MKIRRRHLWTIGVAAATVVLAAVLALVALGILVLPGGSPPAPVKVTSVQFTLLQGTNASGNGWFGPSTFTYTGIANGYPFSATPGGSFSVPLVLENFDNNSHTIYSIQVAAPFAFSGSSPTLPATMSALQDSALIEIEITAPSSPGATLILSVTVNSLAPTG